MSNLFRAYTCEGDKYNRFTKDNSSPKFVMALDLCEPVDVLRFERHCSFWIMLVCQARQYYFDVLKSKYISLVEIESAVEMQFQTPGRTRALLHGRESISQISIFASNLDKPPLFCLKQHIEQLSDNQTSPPSDNMNKMILCDKLLNANKVVVSC